MCSSDLTLFQIAVFRDLQYNKWFHNDRYETIYYKAFQIAVFRDLQYNDEK